MVHEGQQLTVEVDRISHKGNPIAYPVNDKRTQIHAPGAKVGDVVDVVIIKRNYPIGIPSELYEAREEYKKKKRWEKKQINSEKAEGLSNIVPNGNIDDKQKEQETPKYSRVRKSDIEYEERSKELRKSLSGVR